MIDERKKVKIFVVICVVAFIGAVVFAIFNYLYVNYNNMVKVVNLGDCAEGVSKAIKETTFSNLYEFVTYQNKINDKDMASTYDGMVREGTCTVRDSINQEGKMTFTSVDFILDIEELQYSYRVEFNYIKPGSDRSEYVDLGSTMVSCLREREMIYPDFGCDKNELILNTNGYAIDWEIFSALPYIGDGYTLTYTLSPESVSGYSIVFKYNIPEDEFKNGTYEDFIKKRREMAKDYLKDNNVNLDDYSLIESKRYW